MSGIDRAERAARRLGALVAIAAASTLLPGLVSVVRERGAASGRPELVFTPLRLLAVGIGWFGLAGAAWRPLPVQPGRIVRWTLLAGGLVLYLAGMGLAVAGRLALGSSYRPSSSVGATLAPDQRLVTGGPFALVRHPMYLGLALAAIGALAVYRTWSTLLFVIQLPVLVVRARREEALLARRFGEAWERYAGRVTGLAAILPGVTAGTGRPEASSRGGRPSSFAAACPTTGSGPGPHRRRTGIAMITRDLRSSEPRPVTAQVRTFIARRPELVFDYFADLRNEPQYNRQVGAITKTSPGLVAQDTTFEGEHRGLGRVTWRLSEFERPKHVVIEGQVGQGACPDFSAKRLGQALGRAGMEYRHMRYLGNPDAIRMLWTADASAGRDAYRAGGVLVVRQGVGGRWIHRHG